MDKYRDEEITNVRQIAVNKGSGVNYIIWKRKVAAMFVPQPSQHNRCGLTNVWSMSLNYEEGDNVAGRIAPVICRF